MARLLGQRQDEFGRQIAYYGFDQAPNTLRALARPYETMTEADTQDASAPKNDTPPPATILIVDDQPENLVVLTGILQKHYRVRAAKSGPLALLAAGKEPKPDLILLDIMMPDMDGYTVLSQLRLSPSTADIPVIFVTALDSEENEQKGFQLGAVDYITKPLKPSIVLARVQTHLTLRTQYRDIKVLNGNLENLVKARTEQVHKSLALLQSAHSQLKSNFVSTIQTFANLLEMREQSLMGHARRVAQNARNVAHAMNLSEVETQNIFLAALVHDIGKIGLPDRLFKKPFESLKAEEREHILTHPIRGCAVLMGLEQLSEVSKLIRWQNEWYDGSGYPKRLRGEEIPLGTRIIRVVNDYDELRNGLLTVNTMTRSQAMNYLVLNKNKRYDPAVVDVFFNLASYADIIRSEEDNSANSRAYDGAAGGSWDLHKSSKPLRIKQLKPGMILGKSIVLSDGLLLLAEGQILTHNVIEQLAFLEQQEKYPVHVVHVSLDSTI